MTDTFTKKVRSKIMSKIRSRDTQPEKRLFNMLKKLGISVKNHPRIEGSPDFYLPSVNAAVFVDGCFWHGCKKCYRPPKSNVAYWKNKALRNAQRDVKVSAMLRKRGYCVIRIWEHEL